MVACSACGIGSTPNDQSRFELKQDDKGRVIRLDRVTGEVTAVDASRLVPAEQPLSTKAKSESPAGPKATGLPAPSRPASTASRAVAPAMPRAIGQTFAVAVATPIYQTPAPNQTPLRVVEAGFVLSFISSDGTWYRVMFDDPTGGRLYGYVAAKSANAPPSSSSALEPLDLSIRDVKPSQLEPLDLSVPTDLSVPGA